VGAGGVGHYALQLEERVPTPQYAGRIDDVSDFMLAHAWRPGDEKRGAMAPGWGASEYDVMYWVGATAVTFVEVGLPPEPRVSIAYEDVNDVLLGTAQTRMRADFANVHLLLERYAYGSYPERVWTATLEPSRREGSLEAIERRAPGLRPVSQVGAAARLNALYERMVEINLERLR
jgi:hypothetical protein